MRDERDIYLGGRGGRGPAVFVTVALLLTVLVWRESSATAAIQTAPRPDAWIKLCGLSTGCTIDPNGPGTTGRSKRPCNGIGGPADASLGGQSSATG